MNPSRPIKVMHLITGLHTGGAEVNLHKLVLKMDRSRFVNTVVSILPTGPIGAALEKCGVPVFSLNIKQGVPDPRALVKLWRQLHQSKPDILQTWMPHADLLGGLTARLSSGPPVVWNIRQGESVLERSNGVMTRLAAKLCAYCSRMVPAKIVCCSVASVRCHSKAGYDTSKMIVIFNGYDSDVFRPDPHAAARFKAELGLDDKAILIENIARFHPHKDHSTFLSAAHIVKASIQSAQFILCGDGITWENTILAQEIDKRCLRESVRLLGRREDVNYLMAAADVVVSSSSCEGFPNVIAEAMACGAACVATDVGETRYIVGDTGFVVPPKDPRRLAEGILQSLVANADQSNLRGRERIIELFDLHSAVERYEQLYEDTIAKGLPADSGMLRQPIQ